MTHQDTYSSEGGIREQLAAYFLSLPPFAEQTPAMRREYLRQLQRLGELERQEIRQAGGNNRPLVWGNPASLLQVFLSTAQRLAAGLGQPLMLFPAKDAVIGGDTLLHPRVLNITIAAVLRDACAAVPRRPVWVRLQEQHNGLAILVTAEQPFATEETLALIKECTRLHSGSLVHCDNSIVFTCGQVGEPSPGARLYCCPTEEDLMQDTLSPVWSGFYAGIYSSFSKLSEMPNNNSSAPAVADTSSLSAGSSDSATGAD